MRILITGSRDWTDTLAIAMGIADARLAARLGSHQVTVVHGAARGADNIAATYASRNGYYVEPHPAQWRPYGIYNPQAGLIRNREMVELGADVCLAFIKNGSRGATHCADLAEAAGIPTKRFEA